MASFRAPNWARKGPSMKPMNLTPRDHAEAIAVFRAELVGALTKTELAHGDLAAELTRASRSSVSPASARPASPAPYVACCPPSASA